MNELNQVWRAYDLKVVPKDAHWKQRVETKRAWFAGAAAVANLLQRMEQDDVSAPERQRLLDSLGKEIREYQVDVANDRA